MCHCLHSVQVSQRKQARTLTSSFLECVRWRSISEITNNLEYLGSLIHHYIKLLGNTLQKLQVPQVVLDRLDIFASSLR